jgi:HlyD family secretion protein
MSASASAGARRRYWLIPLVVLLVAGAAYWFSGGSEKSAPGYNSVKLDRGEISVNVSATGSLKALSTVDIGTQVSGQVLSVHADFNESVTAGQVIARIDPANFQARLTQARADLASARAGLQEAQANLKNAEADFVRKTELVDRQLVSRSELDLALAARDQSRARVSSAQAVIAQRQAAVANAELDLTYTEIRAPVDGVVLLRQVEPGQTVAASFQTPVLFQIAEDLAQMQIELAVDESDVGRIRPGLPVRFTVDAFPGQNFSGEVRQVRLASTNVQNVITYPVVIDVDNADLSLLPGMTASATIEVARRSDVLRVPNAALRFKPENAAEVSPSGRSGFDMGPLVDALELTPAQRAAYESDAAAVRERMAAMRSGGNWQGGQGGGQAGAAQQRDPAAMAARIAERINSGYAGFLATLEPSQRERFDAALKEELGARRGTLWVIRDGNPSALPVRIGISDATHSEVRGVGLEEGMDVLSGQARAR